MQAMDDSRTGGEGPKAYHDYGYLREEDVVETAAGDAEPTINVKSGRGQDKKFPTMLHYILSDLEKEGMSDIMGWLPHGRAFIVRDHKRMESEILPNWFRQKKFHSFQRQLNIYGFARLSSGPDKGSYYHELFLRGKPYLCDRIVRTKIKGEGPRKPNNPDTEPTLSLYPPMLASGRVGLGYGNRSHEGGVDVGSELDATAAQGQAEPAAAEATPCAPTFATSLGVTHGLPPANLSRLVPLFPEPRYAIQSANQLIGTDLVGAGGMVNGGLVYPLPQRNMYLQSFLHGPSLGAAVAGGGWRATGSAPSSAPFTPCFGVPPTVGPLVQSTQLYQLHQLQRSLQEQQLRSLPLHALPNQYGVLGELPASSLAAVHVLPAEMEMAIASSVSTDPDSSTRPRRTTDPPSRQTESFSQDESSSRASGHAEHKIRIRRTATATSPEGGAAASEPAARRSPGTSPQPPKTKEH